MKHVSIEILQRCPNKCMHCSSNSKMKCSIKDMDVNLVKEVFDGLQKLNVEELSISGGEPFLHKNLVDIVQYGAEKGFKINIYTSGIMKDLNGNNIPLDEQIIESLSTVGVNKLIFNMQSLKEKNYDRIMRTRGNLPLLKESMKRSKKNKIYTEIHFVPMKLNYKEIKRIVNFVKQYGLDRVSFLGLIPHGRAKINKKKLYLSNKKHLKVRKVLNQLKGNKVRVGIPLQIQHTTCVCNAGKQKLYIKFDGKVYGCEAFKYIRLHNPDNKNEDIQPNSIYKDKIEWIYENSPYLKAADDKIKEIFAGEVRENCPIQENIRDKKEIK